MQHPEASHYHNNKCTAKQRYCVYFTEAPLIQSVCVFWTWPLTSAPLLDFYLGFSGLISVAASCRYCFLWNWEKYKRAFKNVWGTSKSVSFMWIKFSLRLHLSNKLNYRDKNSLLRIDRCILRRIRFIAIHLFLLFFATYCDFLLFLNWRINPPF